jgi:hypothetical protein
MKVLNYLGLICLGGIIATALLSWNKDEKLSDGERANIRWEVQNLMSKHEYYHAADMNREEVDALWVDAKGANANTATFASPMWVMNGIAVIRGAYGDENHRRKEEALKKLSEADPSVKNIPENLGAGHEWVMHTSTTPVIEVAEDGQTAKGIWYSPGMGLMTQIKDGKKINVSGTFFWEKYGGDFIKENGKWKIWHLQMAYDFTPSISEGGNWTDFSKKAAMQAGETQDGPFSKGLPPGFSKPKFSYPDYSPQRPAMIYPKIPKAYRTFSETFSY